MPREKNLLEKESMGINYPVFYIGGVNLLYIIIRNPDLYTICNSSIGLILGISNVDNHGGCGGLWFVVTLLLLKYIFQYVGRKKTLVALLLFMLPMTFIYREAIVDSSLEFWGFGVFSVFIAYPFFLAGYLLSVFCHDKICQFSFLLEHKYVFQSFIAGVLSLALLYMVSPVNDVVYMIYGGYGSHFVLFVLYSIIGILGVYFLSVAFSNSHYTEFANTISMGNIVILAFQGYFIERIAPKLELLLMGKNAFYEWGAIIAATVIMLLFVPVIRFCQRYVPVVLGKRN